MTHNQKSKASPADERSSGAYPLPLWFRIVNLLALGGGFALFMVYVAGAFFVAQDTPYDYGLLMSGAERFCFQPEQFAYNGEFLYPGAFYTTFCGLYAEVPGLLLWSWMLLPFGLMIAFAGGRAAVLGYPPFIIHTQLGQSTWLLLPLYWLAYLADKRGHVQWWYGLAMPFVWLKPHLALLPFVWLLWYGRRQVGFWLTTILSTLAILLPSFLLYPTWLMDWLSAGRGFKLISLSNLSVIPVKALQLGEEQVPLVGSTMGLLLVLLFGGTLALMLLWTLYRRRGKLTLYDWTLVFLLTNPFVHDYDLILLLPFIGHRPRRLLLALTASLLPWLLVTMTDNYHLSVIIPWVLLVARYVRLDTAFDPPQPRILQLDTDK